MSKFWGFIQKFPFLFWFASLSLHVGLLLVPFIQEQPQPSPIKLVRRPSAQPLPKRPRPKPKSVASPSPTFKPTPSPQVVRSISPSPFVPPSPTPSPSPKAKASPTPTVSPSPSISPSPSASPPDVDDEWKDFPHIENAQPACQGFKGCWRVETGQWRTIAEDLEQQLDSQGYTVTPLDLNDDVGLKVYEISKEKTLYYLHLISTDQGTVYISHRTQLNRDELEQKLAANP